MTGLNFIREYYCSSVITREYKSAQQELLASIFNLSAIALKQCVSYVALAQHASYLQIFSRHEVLLTFFINLYVSYTVCICNWLWKKPTTYTQRKISRDMYVFELLKV